MAVSCQAGLTPPLAPPPQALAPGQWLPGAGPGSTVWCGSTWRTPAKDHAALWRRGIGSSADSLPPSAARRLALSRCTRARGASLSRALRSRSPTAAQLLPAAHRRGPRWWARLRPGLESLQASSDAVFDVRHGKRCCASCLRSRHPPQPGTFGGLVELHRHSPSPVHSFRASRISIPANRLSRCAAAARRWGAAAADHCRKACAAAPAPLLPPPCRSRRHRRG